MLEWFASQLLPLCWGMMLAVWGLVCWPGDRSPERGVMGRTTYWCVHWVL